MAASQPSCAAPLVNLEGQRFERWLVGSYAGHGKYWECRCDCGKVKVVRADHLASGKSKSCGCLSRELAGNRARQHGLGSHYIHGIWRSMIARCHQPGASSYHNYGARGIKVCERWCNSVTDFYADMGDRPTKKHSLDRIDNDGDYCPENCRWATKEEQGRNTRQTHFVTYNGKTQCLKDWCIELGVSYNGACSRMSSRGKTALQALGLERSPQQAKRGESAPSPSH